MYMKKLAILFLLTTVLIGGVFAQASVKAQFGLGNVSEANDGKMDPALSLFFNGAGSQEVGPGVLAFEAQAALSLSFQDVPGRGASFLVDDTYGKIGYSLAAGPGTLGISLKAIATDAIKWEPEVNYTGVAVGPATLGFGVWYDFKTTGQAVDGYKAPFGKYEDGNPVVDGTEYKDDDLGIYVTAAFDFGLNVKYQFVYGVGAEEIANIAYLDVNYQVMEPLNVGVELDATANKAGDVFKGFQIKPYASYVITENMSAGLEVKLSNIAQEENHPDGDELTVNPAVWFKYSL
jgi:hypothetical protein